MLADRFREDQGDDPVDFDSALNLALKRNHLAEQKKLYVSGSRVPRGLSHRDGRYIGGSNEIARWGERTQLNLTKEQTAELFALASVEPNAPTHPTVEVMSETPAKLTEGAKRTAATLARLSSGQTDPETVIEADYTKVE